MLEQFLPVEGKSIHKVFKQEFVPPTIARSRLGAVSISGRGFTPFRQIVIGRDTCGWPPPPVAATDINGDCETEFIVPAGMEPDAYALTVYMPYRSEGVFTAYTVAPGEPGVKGRDRQGLRLRLS